jgi:hypothetical protein
VIYGQSLKCKIVLYWRRHNVRGISPTAKFRRHCVPMTSLTLLPPSKLAQGVPLPICIWDMSGSNLGQETSYPHRRFVIFLSLCGQYLKLGQGRFLPRPFHFIFNESSHQSTRQVFATDSVVK